MSGLLRVDTGVVQAAAQVISGVSDMMSSESFRCGISTGDGALDRAAAEFAAACSDFSRTAASALRGRAQQGSSIVSSFEGLDSRLAAGGGVCGLVACVIGVCCCGR